MSNDDGDTTIRVKKSTKAVAQEAKRDSETWDKFVQRLSEEPPVIDKALVPVEDVTGGELTKDEVREVVREVIRDELGEVLQR